MFEMKEERGVGRRCSTIAHVNSLQAAPGLISSRQRRHIRDLHPMPKIDDSRIALRVTQESKAKKAISGKPQKVAEQGETVSTQADHRLGRCDSWVFSLAVHYGRSLAVRAVITPVDVGVSLLEQTFKSRTATRDMTGPSDRSDRRSSSNSSCKLGRRDRISLSVMQRPQVLAHASPLESPSAFDYGSTR